MSKRENPYCRLKRICQKWAGEVEYRQKKLMFSWTLKKGASYNIDDFHQRIIAAGQLGYEVVVKATDNGIDVHYKKEIPERPYELHY